MTKLRRKTDHKFDESNAAYAQRMIEKHLQEIAVIRCVDDIE